MALAYTPRNNTSMSIKSMTFAPWILGLSQSHNGSACLLHGDELVVAIQEERLTRTKRQRLHPERFALCIPYCLDYAGINVADLDAVAIGVVGSAERSILALRDNPLLAEVADRIPFLAFTHHLSHAAYGVAAAGVSRAAVLVADGMGSDFDSLATEEKEAMVSAGTVDLWESMSIYEFTDGVLVPRFKQLTTAIDGSVTLVNGRKHVQGKRVLGLGGMYERSSRVIFGVGQESGKVMGLAPFGTPSLPVSAFHSVRDDGALDFRNPPELSTEQMERSQAGRDALEPTSPCSANLAAAVQQALEHGMLHFARLARTLTTADTLVLSGGVALNGVANERIIRETDFAKVHLPPAVEDCGNAVGAAYLALWSRHDWRKTEPTRVDAAGRPYRDAEIDAAITANPYVRAETLGPRMIEETVARLMDGQILGWFQGRSELGPRALGQRSILCDPRPVDAKERLNLRVKRREAFRPFAPLVLAEHAREWFDLRVNDRPVDLDGPFMTRVVPILPDKRTLIPAVTHVDGSGRFQTVGPENGPIYDLLCAFYRRTGVPVLLNTSFNLASEPIVETPSDALFDLVLTDIDAVVAHDRLVVRAAGREPGILDLIPTLTARRIAAADVDAEKLTTHSVVAAPADPMVGRALDLFFRATYPGGPMPVRVLQHELALLMLMDGKRTGWELLTPAQKMLGDKGARWLETILAGLARRRVIMLTSPDKGPIRLL